MSVRRTSRVFLSLAGEGGRHLAVSDIPSVIAREVGVSSDVQFRVKNVLAGAILHRFVSSPPMSEMPTPFTA
jgi:hypothetical protein